MQLKSLGNLKIAKDTILGSPDDLTAVTNAVKILNDKYAATAITVSTLTNAQKIKILTDRGLSIEEAKTALQTVALSESQKVATGTTTSLSTAYKGLAASIGVSTAALTAFIAILGAGLIGYRMYSQYQKELATNTQEAANTFKAASRSIDDYADKYQALHKELTDANTTEERQYEIKKELLEIQTSLNEKYGDEFGKINLVTDAYRDQTDVIGGIIKYTYLLLPRTKENGTHYMVGSIYS